MAKEWATANRYLNECLTAWRAVPRGRSLSQCMPEQKRQAISSTLSETLKAGGLRQISNIIQRLVAHDQRNWSGNKKFEMPDTVLEDWLRILQDKPLACIWWAYEEQIRTDSKWTPDSGQFLALVERHEIQVERMLKQLEA